MHILSETIVSTLASHTPLTVREALSGAVGSISITCWIFLLVPQLIENYRNQSAEALSLLFVFIWTVGDVTNLLGALWAGLVPTAIANAAYFIIVDIALTSQALYYNIRNRRKEGKTWLAATRESISGDLNGDAQEAVARVMREQPQSQEYDEDEEQPLLKRTSSASGASRRNGNGSFPINNKHTITPAERRSSIDQEARRRRSSQPSNHLAKILEETDSVSGARLWFTNIMCLLAVAAVGTAGWYSAYRSGAWKPRPLDDDGGEPIAKGAQILGYISAVAYLGARIPQIIKNWREQSCEGKLTDILILKGLMFGNCLTNTYIL